MGTEWAGLSGVQGHRARICLFGMDGIFLIFVGSDGLGLGLGLVE